METRKKKRQRGQRGLCALGSRFSLLALTANEMGHVV